MKRINACGVGCPQPVLMTKKALKGSTEGVEVVVDSNTAKANVERYLKSEGYQIEIKEDDGTFIISTKA